MNALSPLQQLISDKCDEYGLVYDVLGTGSSSARIAIIAEYPGDTEKALKQPLVGGSGRYLWTELAKIGIKREQCYVTNVIKHVVINTDTKEKSLVPAEELQKWETILRHELRQLTQVQYILLLGNAALHAVTGHKGIKKWRGSVLPYTQDLGFATSGHLLITYNPAFCLRDPSVEPHFRLDLARLHRVINGTYKEHVIHALINPTKADALDYLRKLRTAPELPVSFDIETIANETACIGFANNNHEGMCINFRDHNNSSRWNITEEMVVRHEIAELFADRRMKFVAQNGTFDSYWLWYKDRIQVPQIHFDTLLGHHTLFPMFPHNLGFLTTAYTEHPYYKDEKDTWKTLGDINRFWEYNVKDCCITRAAYRGIEHELIQAKLDTFFYTHVMRLQPHLVGMTINGVLIDSSLRASIASDLTAQLENLETDVIHKARLATGDPVYELNPRSTPQLKELFFNKLHMVGRGSSTDDDNRTRMRLHPNTTAPSKELLNALDTYKTEHKFYSTYVDTKIDEDGRMRCEYRQWGTQSAPGRLSSSSVMWGSGGNLQNQPVRARPMFTAPKGYGFVYFDESQAEARYVAKAWRVKGLLENFELALLDPDRYDVHRLNAARIFQKPYDEIPKEDWDEQGKPTLRYIGKRCVHGLNYRMAPDRLATVTKLSLAEATRAHRLYHAAFPEISLAWKDILNRVKRDRVLFNSFGRRWILLTRLDQDEVLDSIVAFEPQSSIGDKVCETIYLSHDDSDWPRSRHGMEAAITLNIHDALIALARLEDMERVARVMQRHALRPLIVHGEELHIPIDLGMSVPDEHGVHRWSTIQKVKLK